MNTLLKIEMIIGNHGFEKLCSGCANWSKVREGMLQTVHLTIANKVDKEKGEVSPSFYCQSCVSVFLDELKREKGPYILSGRDEEEKARTVWKELWEEIEIEKGLGAMERKRKKNFS